MTLAVFDVRVTEPEDPPHVHVRRRSGAWDTPASMEPLVEVLESAGHAVIVVDLPCEEADATLERYAEAVRRVLPDDLAAVVLVG